MVAAGMQGGDFSGHIVIPEDIGALKFKKKIWSPGSELEWKELKTRQCKREDFNWGEDDENDDSPEYLFYKVGKSKA